MPKSNKVQPSILPGFMELLPRDQLAFNRMRKTIQESYELCGFTPLDTPIIEKANILLAKTGGETNKQIYTLKKGDNDLALRFDLTVPLARYVAQRSQDITFPFKRYQIGKVYRGERPQRGRFREFYQCDIDIIGFEKLDLVNDAEIAATIYLTFKKLGLGGFEIKINNRKILTGFITELGLEDKQTNIIRYIDKLSKIGKENFIEALEELEISKENSKKILNLLDSSGIEDLKKLAVKNEEFNEGLNELETVSKYLVDMEIPQEYWTIDVKIARGLDYYTGTVYETILKECPELGSVCGGGRYDNLAEYYTDKKLPGVGVSIGLTRLFYQLNELSKVKKTNSVPTKILLIPLEGYLDKAFSIATNLRINNIPTEIYTNFNLKKAFKYADKIGVPFVGVLGEDEITNNEITIKNMETKEQSKIKLSDLSNQLSSLLDA